MRFLEGMKQARRPSNVVVGFLVVLVGFLISGLAPLVFGLSEHDTSTFKGQLLLTSGFAIWIALIFAWVKFREGRSVASIGFATGAARGIVTGAIAGLLLTSIVVGVSVATGQATLGAANWAAAGSVCVLLLGFSVQASAEEIAYRGYLSQVLAAKWPTAAVMVAQAIVFTAGHVGNGLNVIPIITMLAVSYFLMMWILATNNLWGAMAFHTFWNWSQANVWGASVSNIKMDTHLFSFNPAAGSDLLTGGSFGLEGSVLTIAMLIVGGVFFHMKWKKNLAA